MLDKEAGFPRDSRLLRPAQYRAVFQHPIKTMDDCFTVICRPSSHVTPRLGLAISKKHARLAVDRNRIKRVVRESFRRNSGELGGIDYVVLNRKGATSKGNRILSESLGRHWKKIRNKAASANTC